MMRAALLLTLSSVLFAQKAPKQTVVNVQKTSMTRD